VATGRTGHGDDARWVRPSSAAVAWSEGQYDDAVEHARVFGTRYFCHACADLLLARSHDGAGRADSALAHFEAYATSGQRNVWWDYPDLAASYRRLGELHEAGGDRDQAVEWYGRFVDLWDGADPALQPIVQDVRARIQRPVGERPS
jgi:tetratricopeptide (TPR) repeat protein